MRRAPHGHQGWGPHVHGKYSPKTLLTVHSMLGQTFVATSAFAVFIFSQHAWTDLCCHIGLCCHYFATSAFGRPLFTACLDRPLLPHRPLLSLLCSILAHRHMLSLVIYRGWKLPIFLNYGSVYIDRFWIDLEDRKWLFFDL